jgi:hypothetical protein
MFTTRIVATAAAAPAEMPFAAPVVTVLRLRGNQIVSDDYYSKAEVIRQSGQG